SRVSSSARWIRALAGLARCERPTSAPDSASTVQPGRFAQGPEEKLGLAGRTAGLAAVAAAIVSVMLLHPYRWASLVGEGWPAARIGEDGGGCKGRTNCRIAILQSLLLTFASHHTATRLRQVKLKNAQLAGKSRMDDLRSYSRVSLNDRVNGKSFSRLPRLSATSE